MQKMSFKAPPLEQYQVQGVTVNVLRLDLMPEKRLPQHGKVPGLALLLEHIQKDYTTVGCFCPSHSNWIAALPQLAWDNDMHALICYGANKLEKVPSWLQRSLNDCTTLKLIRPNVVPINVAQAKRLTYEQAGFFLPFGLEHPIVIAYLTSIFAIKCNTLVTCSGSGTTLASILKSIELGSSHIKTIHTISAGRSIKTIEAALDRMVGPHWRTLAEVIIHDGYKYNQAPDASCPWPAHSYYELKAYDWMLKNIYRLKSPIHFLNIGADSND